MSVNESISNTQLQQYHTSYCHCSISTEYYQVTVRPPRNPNTEIRGTYVIPHGVGLIPPQTQVTTLCLQLAHSNKPQMQCMLTLQGMYCYKYEMLCSQYYSQWFLVELDWLVVMLVQLAWYIDSAWLVCS